MDQNMEETFEVDPTYSSVDDSQQVRYNLDFA